MHIGVASVGVMATPTLLQGALAFVFALLGFEGFWVSIHPPQTTRHKKIYIGVFAGLTALGFVLICWQLVLAERAQVETEKTTAELRKQIAVLYESQVSAPFAPTQKDVNALADRVYLLRRNMKFRQSPTLNQNVRLLAAEIAHFAAERRMNVRSIEALPGSDGSASLVDDIKEMPVTTPLSMAEQLHESSKSLQAISIDPLGRVGVTPQEVEWLKKNDAAIDYYFDTLRMFHDRFSRRVEAAVVGLEQAGVIEKWVAVRMRYSYQRNELGMRELARRLGEAAEKLPEERWAFEAPTR